jgi:quercetin 2,3-dioxygenase
MTMEFTGARLPGGPKPYFLSDGEGEKAIVIDSLFTVLLSADETDGQFGVFTMDGPRVTRSRRTRTAPTTRSSTWSAAG